MLLNLHNLQDEYIEVNLLIHQINFAVRKNQEPFFVPKSVRKGKTNNELDKYCLGAINLFF